MDYGGKIMIIDRHWHENNSILKGYFTPSYSPVCLFVALKRAGWDKQTTSISCWHW